MADHKKEGPTPRQRPPFGYGFADSERCEPTSNRKSAQLDAIDRLGLFRSKLDDELALATDNVTPLVVERFLQWGIPRRIVYGPRHYIGVTRIVAHSSGLFEFHDDGERALIVPEGVPEVPGWDEIHDLIAFKPDRPDRWWRRRGDVDLLGISNISPWRLSPLTIHETPLSWLQAGAAGICILNWGFNPIATLDRAGHLEAETPALKRRLERRIQEAALATFDIAVMEEARHAA